TDWVDPSFDDF
nr:Chain D, Cell cycle checkpoint protein RAD17 [Homo sapiens]